MITKRKILPIAFVVSITLLLFSCLEEDAPLTAYGDVFIESIQKGDSIYYGVYFWTYSSGKLAKVTVNREGVDEKIVLDSLAGRYTYSHIPDSTEFKTTKPAKSNYIFNVDFENGEKYEMADLLDSSALKPVVIKECYFDSTHENLVIDWEGNSLALRYRVVLEDENNKIAFISELLLPTQTSLSIYLNSNGWTANMQPEGGEKYKVSVSAFQYEPIASDFDLQSISVAESGFIEWIINY
jgi:hypothetical protein